MTFQDVRVIVKDGDKARELNGVLALGDGHITVLDCPGGNALVSLPYSSVTDAAYSRSKQPKWKDAEGKDVEAKVDLGKLGFLKSDRNWVILFSHGEPTFLRIEDSNVRPVPRSAGEPRRRQVPPLNNAGAGRHPSRSFLSPRFQRLQDGCCARLDADCRRMSPAVRRCFFEG